MGIALVVFIVMVAPIGQIVKFASRVFASFDVALLWRPGSDVNPLRTNRSRDAEDRETQKGDC